MSQTAYAKPLYTGVIVKMAAEPLGREYVVEFHNTVTGLVQLEGLAIAVPVGLLSLVWDPITGDGSWLS